MKKIFLVDDEILVRESIRENVDWEGEGFRYCGDAPDGEMALPLIETHQPDILITDIKMPFMDGLELSRIVRQKYPHIKIVILTGHDEFEFARSALRLGVTEYCLKPVGSAELVRTLKSIADRIDEERRQMDRLAKMESLLEANRDLRCQKLLSDLCTGLISTPEALHLAATLGVDLTAGFYIVAITEVLPPDGGGPVSDMQIRDISRRVANHLASAAEILSYPRSRTETVWILKGDHEESLLTGLRLLEEELVPRIESAFGCGLVVGTGSLQRRLHGVHASYLAAEGEKTYRKLLHDNFGMVKRSGILREPAVWLDRNRFLEFLRIGDRKDLDSFIPSFASELKRIDWHANIYGFFILNDLTLMALHASRDLIRDEAADMEQRYREWQKSIQAIRSYEDACRYLKRLASQILEWREETTDRYGPILEKVKSFIQQNYHRYDLSLQTAAEYVNVSPSHLSKIFSQGTGITFIEYLTRTRIRKAMELLLTTTLKSYEVAFRVGYNDAHYFSSLFKKVTGMTTKEFRKRGPWSAAAYGDAVKECTGNVSVWKG